MPRGRASPPRLRWSFWVAACLVLAGGREAAAVPMTQTYGLTISNTFADGPSYGTVTLTADTATGIVTATFTANAAIAPGGPGSNFGLQEIGLNTDLTLTSGQVSLSTTTGWNVSLGAANLDGFGQFNVRASTTGSNRLLSQTITITGLGSNATLSHFTIGSLKSNGDIPDEGSVFFAAHIAGFGTAPGSHYVGGNTPTVTPVPEPTAMAVGGLSAAWLLLSAAWARRRRQTA